VIIGWNSTTFAMTLVNDPRMLLLIALIITRGTVRKIVDGLHQQNRLEIKDLIGILSLMGRKKRYKNGVR